MEDHAPFTGGVEHSVAVNPTTAAPAGSAEQTPQPGEPGEPSRTKQQKPRKRQKSEAQKARDAERKREVEELLAKYDAMQKLGEEGRLGEPAARRKDDAFERTERRSLIEDWLKIRDKRGHHRKLLLNGCQQQTDHLAGKRNIVLKARQVGITTYVAARFFLETITRPGTLSVQVAHDQQSAQQIFRIVHRFLEYLPPEWRRKKLRTSRANVRQIIFPELDSEYRVESAADRCAGRGLTIQNLHCSEVARWPHDVAETLAALRAAVPPDGEIFLESTPSGAGGTFYEEWLSAPETGYVRHFFPWWCEPGYRREGVEVAKLTDEEKALMKKHGLNEAQIAFRREMRSQFRNRFPEEYAEDAQTCFLASGNCMFDIAVVDAALKRLPQYYEERANGALLYFYPAAPGRKYIIGVDPAGGGIHGDNACAQVIDVEKGVQCAELLGHYTPRDLAAKVVVLAKEYNQAYVAVERNNHGHAVLAFLALECGYQNLYPSGQAPGWATDAQTRPAMLGRLETMVGNMPHLFLSHRLLQECRSFVRKADGRCEAAPGAHDDTVMAMAIAHAVRAECRVQVPEGLTAAA